MPDQNGWSRYLHFQAAWAAVLTGLIYVIASLWTGHFRRNLLPGAGGPNVARFLASDREVSCAAPRPRKQKPAPITWCSASPIWP